MAKTSGTQYHGFDVLYLGDDEVDACTKELHEYVAADLVAQDARCSAGNAAGAALEKLGLDEVYSKLQHDGSRYFVNDLRGSLQKFSGMPYKDPTGSFQTLDIQKAEGQAPLFFEFYASSIADVGDDLVGKAITNKEKDPKAYEKLQELVLRRVQLAAWRHTDAMAVLLEMFRTAMVTTVPCESVFSVLRGIKGEHRSNITTELLAMQLVLNLGPDEQDARQIVRSACDKFLQAKRRIGTVKMGDVTHAVGGF